MTSYFIGAVGNIIKSEELNAVLWNDQFGPFTLLKDRQNIAQLLDQVYGKTLSDWSRSPLIIDLP